MKADKYTKVILTVIAVALVWIAVQLTPSVTAGPEIVDVNISKIDGRHIGRVALPVVVRED